MNTLSQHNGIGRPGGFSLVELITAIAVLSIGMLGTIQAYHFGMDKMRTLREAAVASRAVQDQIEMLRSKPFASLEDRDRAPFVEPKPDLSALVNATPALTIRSYADSALRLKEIEVSIRWSGDNGRTMERSATTFIADKEAGGS
ncbi:MAG TPA: prepilin-type N-terminal cleavage/methylation domain-containing protein [Candidatus Hydrogenedentes bacterium]|nr:prepilin-type N-terminal cleavage/methylation domain-containing protein [Candidatus Hydrogenedentota bacterium]HOT49473.1 prepilin-type N-terminal cleavage/methylation domain-containing protein [Candidatus Hydrogenedentota bacterium]HOV74436.1 prepilin-type N-terminal cleavage/methylation domain-containing protein [Candidatus Hydrogenedentota bacterium]HPC16694.1 prepilin-type N-terminal cleavage/methylation domain-containing protein [Candidatus Hydrogenedentota bacterium]HRT21758.1 prepilin